MNFSKILCLKDRAIPQINITKARKKIKLQIKKILLNTTFSQAKAYYLTIRLQLSSKYAYDAILEVEKGFEAVGNLG